MLSLVPRRSPSAAPARAAAGGGGLTHLFHLADRHWPPLWGLLVLACCLAGSVAPVDGVPGAPETWGRVAALSPLIRWRRRRLLILLSWTVAAMAAYLCGGGIATRCRARPAVVAERPWTPSRRLETTTGAAVRVLARPRIRDGGRWSAPAAVLQTTREDGAPVRGTSLYLSGKDDPPSTGEIVVAELACRAPPRAVVDGGFDMAAWLAGRGIAATASATRRGVGPRPAIDLPAWVGRARDRLQSRLRAHLDAALPPREQAIAAGVLLGGGAPSAQRDPFARLGLAHLFALSGLHVGILAGLALLALRPCGLGPGARLGILAPLLLGYVVLVDLPGSVVRAAGLVVLALVGPVVGRRLDSLRLLGLLIWLNVLWQPASLLDTGTRLSYLAAGGIVAGQRLLAPRLQGRQRLVRGLGAALGVTFSAQLATLPETARSFGFLPLAGPVANLLLVPVFGLVVTLLATGLVVSLAWPWCGQAVLALGWLLLRPLEAATAVAASADAGLVAGLPLWGTVRGAVYPIGLAVLAAALRCRRRLVPLVAIAVYAGLLMVALWRPGTHGACDAWQFDVSQGDCALLRLPDGWTTLVDTGPAWRSGTTPLGRDVVPFLRRLGLRRLDAVVLTHGHADHTGGAAALASNLTVGRWYTAGAARPPRGFTQHRAVAGDTLHTAGTWSLVCLHPGAADATREHENDHSLVLALCHDDSLRGLWTGDLELGGERDMIGHLPPVPARGCDVLKAGHHGSDTSSGAALLERVRPRLVVISCGLDNRHRHPSHGPFTAAAETLDIRRTDLHGTIHLRWDAHGRRCLPAPLDTP